MLLALLAVLGLGGCASTAPGVRTLSTVAAAGGAAVAGGALYRQRGGGVPIKFGPPGEEVGLGTQGARLVWAVPTGFYVAGLAGELWLAPVVGAAAFGGLLLGHAGHQRSGAGLVDELPRWSQTEMVTDWLSWIAGPYDRDWTQTSKELWHYTGMSTIQSVRMAMMVAPVLPYAPNLAWSIFAGMFPAYFVGWRLPSEVPHLEQGAEVGEFLTGSAIYLGLFLASLLR